MLRPTIFLDCDGVLNEEPGETGVLHPDAVRLIPGAGAAVGRINAAGALAIAVTNRAQVGRGWITLATLDAILGRLRTLLADGGGRLDAVYFCPHAPEAGCDCRKPAPGLLVRAAAEWPVDRARAVLIGDTQRDIAAARAFGIGALGVRTGHGCAGPLAADAMFDSVGPAVDHALTSLIRARSSSVGPSSV